MTLLPLLLTGAALAAVEFFIIWGISVKIRNYSLVDVAWSYGVALLAPVYAFLSHGNPLRTTLITLLGIIWSARLGTYLLLRVLRHHPMEDPRYESLRKTWKSPLAFLLFFEIQALTVVVFSLPFLFANSNASSELKPIEWLGLAVALLGILGETTADSQRRRFKADPRNRNEVCQTGLWHYSRHPNYFFESIVWWGFFLVALGSPWGWVTIICPLLMLWLLLRVTGIPLAEQYGLESKGDRYRAYQYSTSRFIPWFPKQIPQNEHP